MRDMKMAIRVALGFCAVFLLMPIMSVIAINRVAGVNHDLTTMNDVNSVKQRHAIDLRDNVYDRAIAVRDVVRAKDPASLKEAIDMIADREAGYGKSAGSLDATLAPDKAPAPEETAIFASIKDMEAKTHPLIQAIEARRQAGDIAGAEAGLAQVHPLFVEWLRVVNQFIDLQEARNKTIVTDARGRTQGFALLMFSLGLVGLGMGVGSWWWATSDVRKLSAMTGVLDKLTRGQSDVTIPTVESNNEIGQLARTMASFRDRLVADQLREKQTNEAVASIGAALERLAQGDLVGRVEEDLDGVFAKLKADFNGAASALQSALTQVAEAARAIDGGASEISTASSDLSQRTEQQAASLEETAAAMNEITATVRATAERAESAHAAVRSAREEAERSGQVVREAVGAMSGIERTSNEISEIISVIDGIAFQTNLLALNAGVEAARAGDAGKGFAVVASEVRALAQRSAEAAKDVKARITASSEQVASGVQLVGETGKALDRIIASVGEVNGLVSEIAASAEREAIGLQQVNTAVSEMDNVTQQNAAMVEQATAAARGLASEAEGMARRIARFRIGDEMASASPVHQLRERAASAGRRIAKVAGGGGAEDWSSF